VVCTAPDPDYARPQSRAAHPEDERDGERQTPPKREDNEQTIDDVRARIRKTMDFG
jgi:hypothetical protein